ncbi:MAG: hypothetical protein ACK2US_00995 [Anaerolineae bacterium]
MIQRKTQNPDYWGKEFEITSNDLQYLSTLLVEEELPRSAEELGRALVSHHCQKEESLIKAVMSEGTPYQPKRSYEIGERVVFPAFDYQVGEIVGTRPGHNPQYGPFQVIKVKFEKGAQREFAAEFAEEHPLNREAQAVTPEDAQQHTPEELAELYGWQVGKELEKRLEAEPDFVRLAGKWFPKDLLVDVNIGHLNLAEAVLDMAEGGPLPTEELLGDLELPEEITPQLRIFSLNYALQEDKRFDEVGPAGQVLWFLHRLEPESVQSTPPLLKYQPIEYDPALLTSEMLALENQLDDEWSNLESPAEVTEPVTIVLTYPHWKSGTLPLSSQLAHVFPTGRTHRIRFVFEDGKTGEEMPGWVVREGHYIYGLEEWYQKQNIPVGAYLELKRGKEPGKIIVRPRGRSRREWVRVALPTEKRLAFEMRKELIACDYDELMIVTEEDPEALTNLRARVQEQKLSLAQLTSEIFPELAKLSPQGTVHAATLYSAVNVAIRMPPGPLLAELASSDTYVPVGDNYWVLHMRSHEI